MKAQVKVNSKVVVEVEGETQKALFQEMSRACEVFGETKCALCNSEDIRPAVRFVTKGKKTYDYHEMVCQNSKCRAKLTYGQNMEGGTLFPIRKLTKEGKPDRDEGQYGNHNGWTKYRGEPKEEESEG
jgi:hypothetical protein